MPQSDLPHSDRERGIRLTVLWRKVDRNGNEYLAGPLTSEVGLAVFFDQNRKTDKSPDAHVYLLPQRKAEEKG